MKGNVKARDLFSTDAPVQEVEYAGREFYMLRDDLLRPFVFGSKTRKFASLFEDENFDKTVVAMGSLTGYNIKGLYKVSELLGFDLEIVSWRSYYQEQNPEIASQYSAPIHYADSASETDTERKLQEVLAGREGEKMLVLPEGCCCKEAMAGAASACTNILGHYAGQSLPKHIWIDSGSGLQSIAIINKFMEELSAKQLPLFHVILIAGEEGEWKQKWARLTEKEAEMIEGQVIFHKPATSSSFGAVNATIRNFMEDFRQKTSIPLDPIYAAKAVYTFLRDAEAMDEAGVNESHLIINSSPGIWE